MGPNETGFVSGLIGRCVGASGGGGAGGGGSCEEVRGGGETGGDVRGPAVSEDILLLLREKKSLHWGGQVLTTIL